MTWNMLYFYFYKL